MLAETTLLTKVAMLLACCMLVGAGGTFLGRNVRSLGAFIGLAILFIAGTIAVYFAAAVSPGVGIDNCVAAAAETEDRPYGMGVVLMPV